MPKKSRIILSNTKIQAHNPKTQKIPTHTPKSCIKTIITNSRIFINIIVNELLYFSFVFVSVKYSSQGSLNHSHINNSFNLSSISKLKNFIVLRGFFFNSSYSNFRGKAISLVQNMAILPIPLFRRESTCFFNRNIVSFIDEHRGHSPKILGAFFMTKPIESGRVSVKPLAYLCESSHSHFLLTKTKELKWLQE